MKKSTWRWLIWGLGAAAALEALLVTLDGILCPQPPYRPAHL